MKAEEKENEEVTENTKQPEAAANASNNKQAEVPELFETAIAKAEDFPELDEGDNVTWKVTYGTITKMVSNKEDTIASFKKKIEDSKAFADALKNAKGTDIDKTIKRAAEDIEVDFDEKVSQTDIKFFINAAVPRLRHNTSQNAQTYAYARSITVYAGCSAIPKNFVFRKPYICGGFHFRLSVGAIISR